MNAQKNRIYYLSWATISAGCSLVVITRGLMVGETPNIDRIANEGGIFMSAYAESSCTAGRTAFLTEHDSYACRHANATVAGRYFDYLRPGTLTLARFLLNLGYTTGQFGKNHLGDNPESAACQPTASRNSGVTSHHLDAAEQVSFPDINSSPDCAGCHPAVQNDSDSRSSEPPGRS